MVLAVKKRWVKRNVDLELLSEALADFCAKRGFRSRIAKQPGGYRILASPMFPREVCEKIAVVITGDSNNFVVRFVSGVHSHSFVKFGFLTSIFGGGSLFLRGLKSEEMLEKLETEFWTYVEMMIDYLSGSVDRSVYEDLRKR